ncbi:polysaccharide deacetylase family protein [Desulfotruncus alcoholivorax]|uniref:polysaccharide deacetylase family protein n=1 Tax=Desulfotruncus alcoholivorax TaxID=265477 RepID=UPI00041CCF6A|nr:polysaccharide deacetylase family protein [Desulfotruncus alcoholivorax]
MRRVFLVLALIVGVMAFLFFLSYRSNGVPVLMYHMVSDWSHRRALAVPVKEFDRQMWYLHQRGYQVMSLETILKKLNSGEPLPRKTVAITFDDGYQDNYINALPVLKKYHFPATVFMPCSLVGEKNLWDIKRGKAEVKMLTREQIAEMMFHKISFQAHTSNHVVLTDVSPARARKEIFDSKAGLAGITGKNVEIFCYPSGRYNNQIKGYVKAAGFNYAFTTRQGRIKPGDDPYTLKRIRVSGMNLLPDFIMRLEFIR